MTVKADPSTALLDVRKRAEELLKVPLKLVNGKDGSLLEDSKTVCEADLSGGETLQAVAADLDDIVDRIKAGLDTSAECWCGAQRSGDWAIVKTEDEGRSTDDDYFNQKLYHLPSWAPGSKPVMFTYWSEQGWMRPSGRGFRFGKPGVLEIIDKSSNELVETTELAKLC